LDGIIQIGLWGKTTDLTLLSSLSVDEAGSKQGKKAWEASRKNIVVNDTEKFWMFLSSLRINPILVSGVLHIVLDNAGFKLLTNLAFASYVLESNFASKVVHHGKCMPWFVSNVNVRDLESLIDTFARGTYHRDATSAEREDVQCAGQYWADLWRQGKFEFKASPIWMTQHSFGHMPGIDPSLFAELA
jgi:damage-control phosphatase, subfamily III